MHRISYLSKIFSPFFFPQAFLCSKFQNSARFSVISHYFHTITNQIWFENAEMASILDFHTRDKIQQQLLRGILQNSSSENLERFFETHPWSNQLVKLQGYISNLINIGPHHGRFLKSFPKFPELPIYILQLWTAAY